MSLNHKAGDRVIAVASVRNGVAEVFGPGVYVGDEVPNKEEFPHLAMFADNHIPNPRINLDSGGTVWGCECWWGDPAGWEKRLASCTQVQVTPEQYRGAVQKKSTLSDYDPEVPSL